MKFTARFYFLSLLGVGFLLCLQTVHQGAVPQAVWSHDAPILYDAGWRAYCGLRPHVDFYSSFGPIIYLFVAAGYFLFGVDVDSLADMNALTLVLLLILTWFSLRGRMPSFWLFWTSLLIGLCFMAPHPLRYPFWISGYAMLYNRQGYAWLMLFVMLLFSPCGTASLGQLKANAFLIGAILAILFFLKVSFFIVAMPLLLVFHAIERSFRLNLLFFFCGFGVITLPLLAYLNFDVVSMLSDLSITARAKALHPAYHFVEIQNIFISMFGPILVAALILFLSIPFSAWRSNRSGRPEMPRQNLNLFFLLIACSIFLAESNALCGHIEDHPLLAAFGVLIVIRTAGQCAESWKAAPLNSKVLFLLSWLWVASYVTSDALSIAYRPAISPDFPRLESSTMRGLILYPDPEGRGYVEKINDGLRLIRKNGVTDEHVTTFDFSSPFAFALKSRPEGGCVSWEVAVNITPASHPSAAKVFKNVDYLMVPLKPESPLSLQACETCYQDYIHANFQLVDKSNEWLLLGRR